MKTIIIILLLCLCWPVWGGELLTPITFHERIPKGSYLFGSLDYLKVYHISLYKSKDSLGDIIHWDIIAEEPNTIRPPKCSDCPEEKPKCHWEYELYVLYNDSYEDWDKFNKLTEKGWEVFKISDDFSMNKGKFFWIWLRRQVCEEEGK